MFDRRIAKLVLTLSGVICLGGNVTFAQTNAETNAGIQFNFSTPGAKSLALGGAFIALADDATAAYTNPAGLTQLSLPELSIEVRNWDYTHVFTDSGRFKGEPTGRGVDTITGLKSGETENNVTGLSFISFVYPTKRWPRWALAFYRHEVANFEADFQTTGAFFSGNARFNPAQTTMSLKIANHGLSTAYTYGKKERLRLGFGISYYDFSIDSTTARFSLRNDRFGPPNFLPGNELNFQTQLGDDNDVGINLGLLWKTDGPWTFGGVYRQGPKFNFTATSEPGFKGQSIPTTGGTANFQVPDVYGLGVAVQPTDHLRIVFDYDHIQYSQLSDDMLDIFDSPNGTDPELERFRADDADEFHLGMEYFVLKSKLPTAIRLGTWYDPDHKIRFGGENEIFRVLFLPGSDEVHYSAGFGISSNRFQIDAAFDYSDLTKTVALSAVIYLGGRR